MPDSVAEKEKKNGFTEHLGLFSWLFPAGMLTCEQEAGTLNILNIKGMFPLIVISIESIS